MINAGPDSAHWEHVRCGRDRARDGKDQECGYVRCPPVAPCGRDLTNTALPVAILSNFLGDSFPALRSTAVIDKRDGPLPCTNSNTPSWLHAIAAHRTVPGVLKKIVLRRHHGLELNKCCREVVGSSNKLAGFLRPLSELLFGLEELTIGGFPVEEVLKTKAKSCTTACIKLIIPPTMHTILCFDKWAMHRASERGQYSYASAPTQDVSHRRDVLCIHRLDSALTICTCCDHDCRTFVDKSL